MNPSTSKNGKRTNSLAFARTDCHTCASASEACDRRRPQCTTCLDRGRKCGGFALPLSWDNSRMLMGKAERVINDEDPQHEELLHDGEAPAEGMVTADIGPAEDLPDVGKKRPPRSSNAPRQFRFVVGGSRNRKRRRLYGGRCSSTARASARPPDHSSQHLQKANDYINPSAEETDDPAFVLPVDQSPHLFDSFGGFEGHYLLEDAGLFSLPEAAQNILSSELYVPDGTDNLMPMNEPNTTSRSGQGPGAMGQEPTGSLVQELNDTLDAGFPFISSETTGPEGLILSSLRTPTPGLNSGLNTSNLLGNQHEALLRMYDTEFCVLPLTSDTALNPFRCRENTSQGSRLLFNSILALCFQHLNQLTGSWSTEALEQRINATKLLDNAFQSGELTRRGLTLLDPILIMFTLDCTLSALGTWTNHLGRVRSILEACGGPTSLDNPRIRSQVGMLIWWDATLALISRQGTIISQRYLDHLVRSERQDPWSFYDLTGCPSDLVVQLFQLADLAKQSEIASSMTWLSFDLTPVIQIETYIRNWKGTLFSSPCNDLKPSSPDEEDLDIDESAAEEALHAQQDRHHCAEAWRSALLLYIERVFKWDRKSPRPKSIARLVRVTLNHVRSCRRTSQTQKQLLLPVFLAGSETGDEDMRDVAIQYCRWWGDKSRYNMFNSVPALLKDVWADQSTGSERRSWWGSVVDRKTGSQGPGQIPMQFLFG